MSYFARAVTQLKGLDISPVAAKRAPIVCFSLRRKDREESIIWPQYPGGSSFTGGGRGAAAFSVDPPLDGQQLQQNILF